MYLEAFAVGGAYFGEGSGPVHEYISCGGTESNLAQCSIGSVGELNCHHGRDVGVICQGRVGLGVVILMTFLKTVSDCDFALTFHADLVYSVTVVTNPSSGPHPIESTVNLTCLLHPQPPAEGVTYQWPGYSQSPVVANHSLPYATLTIRIDHPHSAGYHCWVYYRNQLFASGSTIITVQSKL